MAGPTRLELATSCVTGWLKRKKVIETAVNVTGGLMDAFVVGWKLGDKNSVRLSYS